VTEKATPPGPEDGAGWPELGVVRRGDGWEARVWAPLARSVELRGPAGGAALERGEDGVWRGAVPLSPGADYWLELDGWRQLPDPCSRWQPAGLRGPSRVLDTSAFSWTDEGWRAPRLPELVVYELHVGTFTEAGTFDAVVPHLAELAALGVTAIELMPVGTFPGRRGWGYDTVLSFAPHEAYGGPHALAGLVDAAHAHGLAVILDVVYNHLGPGSELVTALAPYVTDRHETMWGGALDFRERGVREWAIQNAELWVRDYHVDGLRLDATHAVRDDSDPHVLRELAERVRAARPGALVVSEMAVGDLRPLREWGHDAQWADGLHHAVHVLLTGERDGYYEGYGRVGDVAGELTREQGARLVVCAQNHDQVGNRAFGDRLRGDRLRLAAFAAILSRGTPLLFMGEEQDAPTPFLFFSDHDDPRVAQATREGRRREFARFAAFAADDLPDPQDERSFLASKLDRSRADPETAEHYRRLLRLRRELGDAPVEVLEVDEERRLLRVRRGDAELVLNFSAREVDGVPPWSGAVRRR